MDTIDVQRPALGADQGHSAAKVALAEFSALRNEIDNLANAHRFMMNLNLTVVAGIVGLILAEKADPHLLLVGSSNLVGVSILARACLLDLGC